MATVEQGAKAVTDDERDDLEAVLAAALDDGAFETFAEVAGGIIKRWLERGLGGLDPASLDPELAGRLLLSAWEEAAAQCFPDRPPAEVVDLLARLTDQQADARDQMSLAGERVH